MKDESFVVFCHFLSDMFQILSKMSMHFQCNDLILPSALAILRETTENIKMLTKRSSPGGKMEAIRSSLAKQQDDPEMIPCIYEMALKQNPKNEELYSHLFMAYVRIGDYKKQQQAAMNLYKLFSKNPYYFWAVMSIVMQ
ncbi:N-alpha-acetyltransferase 25, NatB auxiliary subunit, partial [Desmophyllum pertusum]